MKFTGESADLGASDGLSHLPSWHSGLQQRYLPAFVVSFLLPYTRHAKVACRQLVLTFLLLWTLPCMAQSALPSVPAPPAAARPAVNLDLSSTSATLSAGRAVANHSATINVGGVPVTVNSTTALTAAEKVAVFQVLHRGQQTIQLGAQGNATGGNMTIGSHLAQRLGSLVVPQGVTVVTRSAALNVAGNLTNAGNIYAVTNSTAAAAASISASNITNQVGGLISTVLPVSGLPGIASATQNLNLNLIAINNIVNAGVIASSSHLNLTAGGSIINSLPTGTPGAAPVIQATRDVALTIGSGNLTNNGFITSAAGSINIATASATAHLNVIANGGTFQAPNGAINLRNASYAGSANIDISGGNFLSKQLNLYGGSGAINLNADQVSGQMNLVAGCAHIYTDTPTLVLGNNAVAGDPVYVNTGGDIDINGPLTITNGPLVLAASHDIEATSDSASITDAGQNIYLFAGVSISVSGGGGTSTAGGALLSGTNPPFDPLSQPNGYVPPASQVTVNLTAGEGGNIDFTRSLAPIIINSSATAAEASGGNVVLAAYSNGGDNGKILLATAGNIVSGTSGGIASCGNGGGAGGNVKIFAGAAPSSAATTMQVGAITTGGAGPGGDGEKYGTVAIATGQPVFQTLPDYTPNPVTFTGAGTITSNGVFTLSTLSDNAGILTGAITTAGTGGRGGYKYDFSYVSYTWGQIGGNGSRIDLLVGGQISTQSLNSYGGGGGGSICQLSAGGGAGGKGGAIYATSLHSDIYINGIVNTSGGGAGGTHEIAIGGGAANNINLWAINSGNITVTGVVLAAGGGNYPGFYYAGGGVFTGSRAGGGGGSFGGAGGGAGGSGNIEINSGTGGNGMAGGGGGGYSGPNQGNGGSGGGWAGGGAGGGAYSNAVYGGAGGSGNSNGSPGQSNFYGHAGSGGNAGINQDSFGVGGPGGYNAGQGGGGGQIHLTGATVNIQGTIGGNGPFAGQSINAQGTGGGITIDGQANVTGTQVWDPPAFKSTRPASHPSSSTFGTSTSDLSLSLSLLSELTTDLPYIDSSAPQRGLSYVNSVARVSTDLTPPANPSQVPTVIPVERNITAPCSGSIMGASVVATDLTAPVVAQLNSEGLALVESMNNVLKLKSGNIFLAPEHSTAVTTELGNIYLAAGAIVFVMQTADGLCVYDLADAHKGDVTVVANKQIITAYPGMQIFLTAHNHPNFAALNPGKLIGQRNIREHKLNGGITAFTSDFSLVSALSQITPLHQLVRSTEPCARRVGQILLKNAAAIAQLHSNQEPYKQCP